MEDLRERVRTLLQPLLDEYAWPQCVRVVLRQVRQNSTGLEISLEVTLSGNIGSEKVEEL